MGRDLKVFPSEHPIVMSDILVYANSAAGFGHCVLLKGKKPSLSIEMLSEY